jgi:hypothetical protein
MPPQRHITPQDANYVPAIEPENTAGRAPQCVRQNARVASTIQLPPNLGEYIDIDVPESSDEEGSLPPGPPINPPTPGPTPQPGSTDQPAPSSQGGDGRTNVAHDINHFYRRGNKNIVGSKTVCINCE